jgi:hypothetical protein
VILQELQGINLIIIIIIIIIGGVAAVERIRSMYPPTTLDEMINLVPQRMQTPLCCHCHPFLDPSDHPIGNNNSTHRRVGLFGAHTSL